MAQVAEQLSSGTGNFDEGHILEDLPKKLKLADGKARTTVQNQAKDRKRTTLVQVRLRTGGVVLSWWFCVLSKRGFVCDGSLLPLAVMVSPVPDYVSTLLQAISYLRQKQLGEVATSLNNLLACEKAQPSERPVKWDPKAELQDLYSSYLTRVRFYRLRAQHGDHLDVF